MRHVVRLLPVLLAAMLVAGASPALTTASELQHTGAANVGGPIRPLLQSREPTRRPSSERGARSR
jgi:hypothetical protein